MPLTVFISCLLVFISSGALLGIAMGATGLIMLHFLAGGAEDLMGMATWNSLNSYTLTALPLFFFMGEILGQSGLSGRLYRSLAPVFERFPGKLLHTNIIVCALFGAISGSSMATAAAVGSIAYPELRNRKYAKRAVAGSLCGGGTLGLLIPPSMSLIMYGAWQDVSVGKLFLAGLVPGIMMAVIFMLYIGVRSRLSENFVPDEVERVTPFLKALKGTASVWPIAVLVFVIMGTIYLGLATPTESAGMGAIAALVMGMVMGKLDLKSVGNALFETAKLSGFIGLILIGASILSQAVALIGLPRQLVSYIQASGLSPILVLVLIYSIYVIMGCFFDAISLLVMTLPFTFPIIVSMGHDPVWFGVVVTMLIEIGLITPPMGTNLYVMEGATGGELNVAQLALASIPYWFLLLLGLVILTAFPQICLWLPSKAL